MDTLRVVEASLAPPPWMGPINAAAHAQALEQKDPAIAKLQEDYGKMVETPELADVVLVVVTWGSICKCSRMRARLPLHILLLHTQVAR